MHIGEVIPCLAENGEQLFDLWTELLGDVRAGVGSSILHLQRHTYSLSIDLERAVRGLIYGVVPALGTLAVDGGLGTEGAVTVLDIIYSDRAAVLHALLNRAVGYDGQVRDRISRFIQTLVVLDVDTFGYLCHVGAYIVLFHCCESFVLGLVCEWPLFARASHTQLRGNTLIVAPFLFERRCKGTTKK